VWLNATGCMLHSLSKGVVRMCAWKVNYIPVTLTINVPEEFLSPVRKGEDTLIVQV